MKNMFLNAYVVYVYCYFSCAPLSPFFSLYTLLQWTAISFFWEKRSLYIIILHCGFRVINLMTVWQFNCYGMNTILAKHCTVICAFELENFMIRILINGGQIQYSIGLTVNDNHEHFSVGNFPFKNIFLKTLKLKQKRKKNWQKQ